MDNKIWKNDSRNKWWSKKRLNYNCGLLISGILSFTLYIIVVEFIVIKSEKSWDGEITIFTVFTQAIGYVLFLCFANLFYYFGSASEWIIEPKNPEKYRKITYNIGYWFSCGIQFLLPISLFIEFV